MEQADFGKLIKSANGRRLIVPFVFLAFIVLVYNIFSISNWVFPLKLKDVSLAGQAYDEDDKYVTCTVKRMMYTGIDHVNNGRTDGYYYYSLDESGCRYYLIEAGSGEAQPILENYTFNARVLMEEEIAGNLDKLMAEVLAWTEDGVDNVASDYIISEIDYDKKSIMLISLMMVVSSAVAVIHVITIIYNIFNPYEAIGFAHLGDKKERRSIVLDANDEYNRSLIFVSQGMYVTENYFIYHDLDDFEIIPLDDIVWAYKHSSLKWNIGRRHFITYNIRIVTLYKKTYVFSGKTKESCDALLESVAGQRPEILIGYSQENKVRMGN